MLPDVDATQVYVDRVMRLKLDIDRAYLHKASAASDLRIVLRTLAVIAGRAVGRQRFAIPRKVSEVRVEMREREN
jgi:hypothetical protein